MSKLEQFCRVYQSLYLEDGSARGHEGRGLSKLKGTAVFRSLRVPSSSLVWDRTLLDLTLGDRGNSSAVFCRLLVGGRKLDWRSRGELSSGESNRFGLGEDVIGV